MCTNMGGRGGSSGLGNKSSSKKQGDSYNLQGSEKQVSYAKDIIKNVESAMKSYIKENEGHPAYNQVKEMADTILKNMKNSYAGDIIEDFKDVPKSGSAEERFRKVIEGISFSKKFMGRDYRK